MEWKRRRLCGGLCWPLAYGQTPLCEKPLCQCGVPTQHARSRETDMRAFPIGNVSREERGTREPTSICEEDHTPSSPPSNHRHPQPLPPPPPFVRLDIYVKLSPGLSLACCPSMRECTGLVAGVVVGWLLNVPATS